MSYYIKGFGGLGLVALGGYIGYHFTLGGAGNATLLGGIIGCILYFVILRLGPLLLKKLRPGVKMDSEDAFTMYNARKESEKAIQKVRNDAFEEILRSPKKRR